MKLITQYYSLGITNDVIKLVRVRAHRTTCETRCNQPNEKNELYSIISLLKVSRQLNDTLCTQHTRVESRKLIKLIWKKNNLFLFADYFIACNVLILWWTQRSNFWWWNHRWSLLNNVIVLSINFGCCFNFNFETEKKEREESDLVTQIHFYRKLESMVEKSRVLFVAIPWSCCCSALIETYILSHLISSLSIK